VHGLVQGVGFRYDARVRARSRGVNGWIRNSPDGSVEAVFEGAPADVDALVEWCRRGPSGSRVDGVDVKWEEPTGEAGFAVR
jgi:acylphosphatase